MANDGKTPPSKPPTDLNTTKVATAPIGLNHSLALHNALRKPPYDGKLDKYGDVRLRIGIIDNPTIKRDPNARIDPLDPYNVINMTTGKVTIRWMEQPGGLIRPDEFGSYGKNGEESDREMLTLSHPVIWADDRNWMGLNYVPPIGSVVIVGFRKHNIPVILGFLQPNYQVNDPIDPGEIMIKGYGHNSSYWTMHDELIHKAWVVQNESRPVELMDAPGRKYKWANAPYTVNLKLRIKAWIDPRNPNDKKEMIELYAQRIKDGTVTDESVLEVRPESVSMTTSSPSSGESSSLTIGASGINMNSSGDITLKGKNIYLN